MQTGGRPQTAAKGRLWPSRWLVAKDGEGGPEPLCVDGARGRALAVFSFEEEAEMFLCLGGHDADGWRARPSGAAEIASLLRGAYADVRGVALDPLPGMAADGTAGLVEVGRERFLGHLLGRLAAD